ncbi:class I SAM-dependent methyltransferase [Comamonadaceae bacterium G21597-S1]|nr:class I SAM-dependent methyltransferase [Comamonadaceae bacterium G21597-S1]
MTDRAHGSEAVSPWIRRWSHLAPAGGAVLDLACGRGRHVRWFAGRGHSVVALDRSQEALDAMADLRAQSSDTRVQTVQADIENQPWPLMQGQAPQTFDAVIVTNYLWRPLLPTIVRSVAPGGVLLYETFAHGNASVGKPSRPDFLLQPGELLRACQELRVVAYEDGFLADPPRFVQRIAAVREPLPVQPRAGTEPAPTRYPL